MEKKITSIAVQKSNVPIRSKGEFRQIEIRGTKGSGFSIEINDSSGDCILEEPIQNIDIPRSGVYTLSQRFPDISTSAQGGLVVESYEIIITPHADVDSDFEKIILYQYPDVTITLSPLTSQSSPSLVVRDTAGDAFTGFTVTRPANFSGQVRKTQTLVITENTGTAGFFYINKNRLNDSFVKNTTFTRKVTTKEEPKLGTHVILKPLTTRAVDATTSGTVTKGSQNYPITGDVELGMSVYGKITKDKIVHKSLEVATCKRATDKFELSDTVGLFPGMTCEVNGLHDFTIKSVDCGKNITVSRKVIIPKDRTISCIYEVHSTIGRIETQVNEDGNTCAILRSHILVVDGMDLKLDSNKSHIFSSSIYKGSGTDTITLDTVTDFLRFGKGDVTYNLDLDNVITRIPNIRDFEVDVYKNHSRYTIDTLKGDRDENASATIGEESAASGKVVAITKQPRHGASSISSRDIYYSPNTDFVGDDEILYTLSDGTNTSTEGRISITVK
jgi:hypothetical protein